MRARARATSASCHNRADGREAPGRKIHFSILRAGVQLAVPRWKITKKKRRIDRRNRPTSITLYYTTEPSSLRSISWFFVDWGSLSLSFPLSFTVNTRADRDSEPRIDERRVRERQREMKRLMRKKERYKETRKRERLEMVITKKGNELFPSSIPTVERTHSRTQNAARLCAPRYVSSRRP